MFAWICSSISTILSLLCISISVALAGEYVMPPPGSDIVGENYIITVQKGDSLTSIREQNDISYEELVEANPQINFYKLKIGQKVVIPKQFILPKFRRGIVINIPELRLYYFTPDGKYVYTFPVGLGRSNWRTPIVSTKVVRKKEDPIWHVPESIRNYVLNKTGELLPDKVLPGPKNPLGKYALYLNNSTYMIHGTNAPKSVGTFISSGCVRLLREPIELLYQEVQVGTPVHIIYYPNKAGWRDNQLYLESHKPVDDYLTNPHSQLNLDAESAIYEAIHLRPAKINWNIVAKNINQHLGMPEAIGSSFSIIN